MVRDGYFYAAPLIAAAILVGWLTNPAWAIFPFVLAAFFLWFFRDPGRTIPQEPGALVSRGEGKATDVSPLTVGVLFEPTAPLQGKVGDRVKGGSSVLAHLQPKGELAAAGNSRASERAR